MEGASTVPLRGRARVYCRRRRWGVAGTVRREERLVIRVVVDITIADGIAIRLEERRDELCVLQEGVEQETPWVLDGRDGLRRNRQPIEVPLKQHRFPSRVHTPLLG